LAAGKLREHHYELADCCPQGADSNQVAVVDVSNIVRAQCNQSLSSARRCDELDLEVIPIMDLDNCAQIAGPKARLWKITFQYYGVEKLKHDHLGNAVINIGKSSIGPMIQTVLTWAERPNGPVRIPST
jgi:hypothetical protein